ncbi:MAG: AMP-binding protein [Lentisphaeria bacterium]|nr:AMP-binding protein [Lentisphaeria bacterium]
MDAFKSFINILFKMLLSLRYKVEVRGFSAIDLQKPTLFLPNHPSEMDPVIVETQLWELAQPRPVVVEDFYFMPGVAQLMHLIRAVPMPNMEGGVGAYKRVRVKRALEKVVAALKGGDNILLYPSGRLMRSGKEELHGTSAVYEILKDNPDVQVILVRQKGMVGSSFSFAALQERPELIKGLIKGAGWVMANLVFLTPRRKISLEFADMTDELPVAQGKVALNSFLENWYNSPQVEELSYVSYCRWFPVYLPKVDIKEAKQYDNLEVSPEVREKVIQYLSKVKQADASIITDNTSLTRDLGYDSLELADIVLWLEEEFFAYEVEPESLLSVGDVLVAASGGSDEERVVKIETPDEWQEDTRPDLSLPDLSLTTVANILKKTSDHPNAVSVGDDSAVIKNSKLRLAGCLFADVFSKYDEKEVGIMLPAVAAFSPVLLGVWLAGKTPVMINWTLGDANLEHVLKAASVKRIITSEKFLDKLEQVNFDLIEDKIVTLESVKKEQLGLGALIKAKIMSSKPDGSLLTKWGAYKTQLDDPAVILFTSGSEAAPKGVPLTHRNILSNVYDGVKAAGIHGHDSVLAFLPPFHSFGFTITTILPLTSGLKFCCYPNPTEAKKITQALEKFRPTICCGTPTFLSGILKVARPDQLTSLRVFISGAEKMPEALAEKANEYGIEVMEGYGITETAPVLSLTPPGCKRVGVGQALENIEIIIVDPESREPLSLGERGLILAHGDNVFNGYLAKDSKDAFQYIDNKKYYVTGDLGFLDEEGNLTLAGRMKRFVKIAGEMISIPAMEEVLSNEWPNDEDGVHSAITFVEPDNERPMLAWFTTFDSDVDAANNLLRDAGFSNLARVQKHYLLGEIPLLGTGKTDYRTLTAHLKNDLGLEA